MIKETSPKEKRKEARPDNTYLREIILIISSAIILAIIIFISSGIIHTNTNKVILGVLSLAIISTFFFTYRGNLLPARVIIPFFVFFAMTYFMIFGYDGIGIHHPVVIGFPAAIVLAGLFLGEYGAVLFGLLTSITIGAVGYAQQTGVFIVDYASFEKNLSADINILIVLSITTGAIVFLTTRLLTKSIEEAKKNEISLKEANKRLRKLQENLEKRIDERTQALDYRASQLTTIAQVAHQALVFQNVDELLNNLTSLISEKFDYYHAGVFLLDDKSEYAILHAASSDGGKKMLKRGHQLRVGSEGIVGVAAAEKRPHIALDVGEDATFFNNPDLPETHSEMVLPLLSQEHVIGVLDIQSIETRAFSQQDIEIFQTLANQIALAIQNAQLIENAQENISQLETLTGKQSQLRWKAHLERQSHRFRYTPLSIKQAKNRDGLNIEKNDEEANISISLRKQAIGKIALKRKIKKWSGKEKELISEVANQVGLAIENTRLVDETREQANRDQIVSEFSNKLRETLDMDMVLKTAIKEMKNTFDLKKVEVRLNTPKEN